MEFKEDFLEREAMFELRQVGAPELDLSTGEDEVVLGMTEPVYVADV